MNEMTDIARMMDDTLDRLLTRRLAGLAGAEGEEHLRAALTEAGLPLLLRAEDEGGLGGTLGDAAVACWRLGWHAAPVDPVALLAGEEARPLPGGLFGADEPPKGEATRDDALLTVAAMTGAMARVMEIAVDYANTRQQFGRPLGKFQALQHLLAEAASELALTEAALAAALEAAEADGEDTLPWLTAKAQAGRAATFIAAAAHQVMGAIGFTEEHPLHHYTRRLWQWRDDNGRQAECEARVGRAALAAPGGLWAYLTDERSEA
ncbi:MULTISPECIES: acyl-CoA dehydrogenase family protein [unclassified Haematobacter]|uniref:acyl-CoA dehydrogenase family protein n=1 Tax=unclassified Haematobacter TaxID=2640585 RepID=UPI0025C59AE4|nr:MULTISPECIES: acyl-CoA dehydrogenase family protein [unclassified Haematobacter]